MRPDDIQPPKRSVDGVSLPPVNTDGVVRPRPQPPRQPEYRYDHELPAPAPHKLLGELATQRAGAPVTPSGTGPALPTQEGAVSEQSLPKVKKKKSLWKILAISVGVLAVLIIAAAAGAFTWYQKQLEPAASSAAASHTRIVVEEGSTPRLIADQLKETGLIRSRTAFLIYTELSGTKGSLKAGTYNLQPSESVQQIVDHLVSGKVDEFNLTFLPGDTLANHRKRIIAAGYSAEEVDAALKKTYDHPALASKPASADLEGYIYGETYRFASSATVEDILTRTFDELQTQIVENNLVAAYKKQGLSLYQGLTLASIIQREVSGESDMKQVAQVFYLRLKKGMMLGSDVTYHYAADKMGVARDYTLDSPYNTRKYVGLPPGPIASPGIGALQAAAQPATGDYLYFVSGDDDKTYFGRTNDEHEANVKAYCHEKCMLP